MRKLNFVNVRFITVMAIYAALALLGTFALSGKIRDAVWLFLGALAVKTLIVVAQRRGE
jgi:hypothetical protein